MCKILPPNPAASITICDVPKAHARVTKVTGPSSLRELPFEGFYRLPLCRLLFRIFAFYRFCCFAVLRLLRTGASFPLFTLRFIRIFHRYVFTYDGAS